MIRRRLAGSYISSVVSIALVLFLLGTTALLIGGARNVTDFFKESMRVSVILSGSASEDDARQYKAAVDTLPCVRESRIVTREEGARQMKDMLGEDFLDIFEDVPIPVSVDVSLKAEYVSADSLEKVLPLLEAPVVDEIEYQQAMVEKFSSNVGTVSAVLGVVALVLLFISFVLIANTVRLDVFARRFNVHTMVMVGATRSFIRRPFLWRSVLQGFVSAMLAAALLCLSVWLVFRIFPGLAGIFDVPLMVATAVLMLGCGILICVVSTWFVVNGLVSLDKSKLYV